ncbi:MAG: Gfo/Idh/MocA family oxidoreductase [Synechococcaceae cyanobacterium RL_1_2]|nr:Gfo/Idh/MocA family oxidoreductase [Synechococcaceae cyanobacterium RL_1_2]
MVGVGIVGTGYAATKRAEALSLDPRAQLLYGAGHDQGKVQQFAENFGMESFPAWQNLVSHPQVDLVVICTSNGTHGAIAETALNQGKHVVVEYPLTLEVEQGRRLVRLAQEKQLLLHVEHIELLGGLHQAVKANLPKIGPVFYGRYLTLQGQTDVPKNWKYSYEQFGFPFMGALARTTRFIDLFGEVHQVKAQNRYWESDDSKYFRAFFAQANLTFEGEIEIELTYGKGEVFPNNNHLFELYGEQGQIIFEGQTGYLLTSEGKCPIAIPPRQGLFAMETGLVLDHLLEQKPIYTTCDRSLYALEVADRCRQAAES